MARARWGTDSGRANSPVKRCRRARGALGARVPAGPRRGRAPRPRGRSPCTPPHVPEPPRPPA
ncbi:hypothetical protein SFR_4671 [Streptomyces sp. FR-008]|nr:hypothetical protein SFR_4671 [Streptomyces sp. FR-008]